MDTIKTTYKKMYVAIFCFLLATSTIFTSALAQTSPQAPQCRDTIFGCFEVGLPGSSKLSAGSSITNFVLETNNEPILTFINLAVNTVIAVLVIIGLITTVIGGYIYMTAGGDASKVKTAKEMIIAALLGIFLSLISVVVLNTINVYIGSKAKEPTLSVSPSPSAQNSSGGVDSNKTDLRAEQIGLALQIEDLQSKLDDPFLSDSQIADYASQISAKQARFNEIAKLLK